MTPSQINYLPVSLPFFYFLVGIFIALVILIQVQALRYAYARLGISSQAALLLLLASLAGSYINIPLARLPEKEFLSGQEINVFGVTYVVPVVVDWPGTVIAVNVGGAVIPVLLSLYLLVRNRIWFGGSVATAIVAAICYMVARPVPGVGIAIPMLVPAVAAVAAALLLAQRGAAAVAYVSGSLGVLIGADLLNLDKIQGLGAPVASIGGAGTFDGVFLTGIVAVLLASFSHRA